MIPEILFIRIADEDSPGSIEDCIILCQQQYQLAMELWETNGSIKCFFCFLFFFFKRVSYNASPIALSAYFTNEYLSGPVKNTATYDTSLM